MNIQTRTDFIKYASRELYELSQQEAGLEDELADVERELRKQTEFETQLRALQKTREDMSGERYRLNVLAQALANIGNLYEKTENGIEDAFEVRRPAAAWMQVGLTSLSGFQAKVNHVLYGGGEEWQQ